MQSPYSVVDTSNYCTKRDTDLDDPEYFGCNGCSGIQRVYTNLRVIFEHSPTIFEAIMTGGPLPEHVSFFTPESNDPHRRLTVEFIVDRGVTHELVRHRVLSFSQESTRYCNYSSGQFGSELTFIEPFFFATDEESRIWQYYEWQAACEVAESSYLRLIELGASPQEARSVLPNSLKSNLVMTGNLNQWRAFFKLRTPSDAHPQMREVAIPLYEEMRTLYPCITLD
jgi:thymidylate synthase (FAD)